MKFKFSVILIIFMAFQVPVFASMGSENYTIISSVMSGGGAPMSSASHQNNATFGQSSPITFTSSTSYELYPGFWYMMPKSNCIWDIYNDGDGDVDGFDLHHFLNPFYESDLESFTTEFGRTDCLD